MRLNIDYLPDIDISTVGEMQWLVTLVSWVLNTREREQKSNPMPTNAVNDGQFTFKGLIFSESAGVSLQRPISASVWLSTIIGTEERISSWILLMRRS
jgi:hypothetical protein